MQIFINKKHNSLEDYIAFYDFLLMLEQFQQNQKVSDFDYVGPLTHPLANLLRRNI